MSTLDESWLDFFQSGIYAEGWTWRKDEAQTSREVDAVLETLQPTSGSHILDWCGGWGRHSIELAKRGYKVTLLDFAANHIEMARRIAKETGVTLELIHSDFRNTPHSIQADYAVNMFTAGIGYLTEKDDLRALRSLHAALKPGARFLLDTMNLFWLVQNYNPNGWHEIVEGEFRVFESREFDILTNRNRSKGILWRKGQEERVYTLDHRVYSGAELASVLNRAGFGVVECFGDFDRQPLTIKSSRLILVSEKH
jgi:SAM-dependent methyltransferase